MSRQARTHPSGPPGRAAKLDRRPTSSPPSKAGHADPTARNHAKRAETLEHILERNPILDAYLLNYLANFYVGPLIKLVDSRQRLTRSEWIVIFCLTQHQDLNAQQISDVTGRAKTSISHAINLLQKKQMLRRRQDASDGRRRVLELTALGREAYTDLIGFFVEREADMLACLSDSERRVLRKLMLKLTDNMDSWAKSY